MKTVHALGPIALLIKTVQNPVVNPVEKKPLPKKTRRNNMHARRTKMKRKLVWLKLKQENTDQGGGGDKLTRYK